MNDGSALEALEFAIERHGDQMYGDKPYSYHLIQAAHIAFDYRFSHDVQVACVLHDIIEDTRTRYHEINERFGKKIAELIYAVTDELGRNRHERATNTKKKFIKTELGYLDEAIQVKLCDRLANARDGTFNKMYAKDWDGFYEFYHDLVHEGKTLEYHAWSESMERLWAELKRELKIK